MVMGPCGGTVGVGLDVTVAVKVGVKLGPGVGVRVREGVGVNVALGPLVAVRVREGVRVGEDVAVEVGVGVFVDPLEVWITSCGALAPSRLEKLMLVLLVVLNARLYTPLPVM
jgi:hypothetical protein